MRSQGYEEEGGGHQQVDAGGASPISPPAYRFTARQPAFPTATPVFLPKGPLLPLVPASPPHSRAGGLPHPRSSPQPVTDECPRPPAPHYHWVG